VKRTGEGDKTKQAEASEAEKRPENSKDLFKPYPRQRARLAGFNADA